MIGSFALSSSVLILMYVLCPYLLHTCLEFSTGDLKEARSSYLRAQYTIVVNSYDPRINFLRRSIAYYRTCPGVHRILVVWNGKQETAPLDLQGSTSALSSTSRDHIWRWKQVLQDLFMPYHAPVVVRVEKNPSLNNKFKPDPSIKTDYVLTLDDDLFIPCVDLIRAFRSSLRGDGLLVGFFPRLLSSDAHNDTLIFKNEAISISKGAYDAVLTGAAFIPASLLELYWNPSLRKAREVVDRLGNGEDILMNYVASNASSDYGIDYAHFIRPLRRIDVAKLSSVAISRNFQRFIKETEVYLALFENIFHHQAQLKSKPFHWEPFLSKPLMCGVKQIGCLYL